MEEERDDIIMEEEEREEEKLPLPLEDVVKRITDLIVGAVIDEEHWELFVHPLQKNTKEEYHIVINQLRETMIALIPEEGLENIIVVKTASKGYASALFYVTLKSDRLPDLLL